MATHQPDTASPKPTLLFVTSEFPAVSHTFVTQKIAAATANWNVHILARSAGSPEGWALANQLGLSPKQVTISSFYDSSPLPLDPLAWTRRITQAAESGKYGRAMGLRRRTFFARLLRNPFVKSATLIHAEWVQQAVEVAIPLGKALGVPVTVSANDQTCEGFASHDRDVWMRDVSKLLTLSDWSLNRWKASYSDHTKLRRVYLGIDPRPTSQVAERNPHQPVTVITVGRCSEQKRQQDLIEATALLVSRGVSLRVIIVGDGLLLPSLKELAQARGVAKVVDFRGALSNLHVQELLLKADIFVLASEWESFGLVTVEAMAASLPTVVSDGGASPELVVPGKTGFIYPVGDVQALANRLQELIADGEKRSRFGKAARSRAEQHFSLARQMHETNSIWLDAIAH